MSIRSFKDVETKDFFLNDRLSHKKKWGNLRKIVKRKLDMLHYANELRDLKSPPGNFLEQLCGDLEGFYSVRVNDQWRIIFRWDTQPHEVDVVDYH